MAQMIAVAIYAAVAATLGLGWKIYDMVRDRPKAKVQVRFDHVFYGNGQEHSTNIVAQATNAGHRPLTLTGAGFSLPNGEMFTYISSGGEFPKRLDEEEIHEISVELGRLKEAIKETALTEPPTIAWFKDATGRYYKGNIPINIRKALLG